MFAGTVLLHAVKPPVRFVRHLGLGAHVGEVIDRTAVLTVVRIKAPVVGCVLQAFLDDAGVDAVDRQVARVLVAAAHVPLAAEVGLVARAFEGLRQQVLAQVGAALVVGGVADGVASGQEGGARDGTNRCRIKAFETDGTGAAGAKAVHRRRLDRHLAWRAVIAHIAPALVVGDDDDNVGGRLSADAQGHWLDGAAPRRVGDFNAEIEIARSRRRAVEQAAAAQAQSRRQGATDQRPDIAAATAAAGAQGLRVGSERAAGRQRRGCADGWGRCHCKAGVAAGAGARQGVIGNDAVIQRGPVGLGRNAGAPHSVIGGAIAVLAVVEHRQSDGRKPLRAVDHNVVNADSWRPRGLRHRATRILKAELQVGAALAGIERVAVGLGAAIGLGGEAVIEAAGKGADRRCAGVGVGRRAEGEAG